MDNHRICPNCGHKIIVYNIPDKGYTAECYSKSCWEKVFSSDWTSKYMHKPMATVNEAIKRWNNFILRAFGRKIGNVVND